MKHITFLKTLPIYFTQTRLNYFRDFSTILAFIMNMIMLYSLKKFTKIVNGQNRTYNVHTNPAFPVIIRYFIFA